MCDPKDYPEAMAEEIDWARVEMFEAEQEARLEHQALEEPDPFEPE